MSRKTLMRKIRVDRSVIVVFFFMVLTPALWAQASVPSAVPSDSDRLAKIEHQVADAKASADNAWMLTSAALVLMMTGPGLALFYGGLVRKKKVLSTMMQSFAMMALISVLWAICGYSLAFGPGSSFIGNLQHLFLRGVTLQPEADYSATI